MADNTFIRHILSLETAAWMFLGKVTNPTNEKIEKNLDQAKEIIDLMIALRDKTKNNLCEEEEKIINDAITQLQYNYVEEAILKKK